MVNTKTLTDVLVYTCLRAQTHTQTHAHKTLSIQNNQWDEEVSGFVL